MLAAMLVPQLLAQRSATPEPLGGTYEPAFPPLSNNYPLTEDSKPQPGVPKGECFQFQITDSKVFPNTTHTITVYVPAAYKTDRPAVVWVKLDGLDGPLLTTLDNLIARHEIPVTVAVGVSPGTVASERGDENPRLQRSFEFDGQSDRLARFLSEEVLPAVEAHTTPSGKPIHLSHDPNDRAIAGGSTGGIAAFTAAFLRPDLFRRVYSTIGTFVGMRGGEQLYVTVRKTEPRPIRVFLNDGANDEWMGGPEMGDWHMANLTMNRALEFAGYDVNHVWGQGSHSGAQAEQIMPDVLRWLFRDYPQPIVAKIPGNPRLAEILVDGQEWQPAAAVPGLTTVAGPRRAEYTMQPAGGFRAGSGAVVAANLAIRALTVRANGDVYAAVRSEHGTSELWRIAADGKETKLDGGLHGATALAFSPDGLWLLVADGTGQHAYDYRVSRDGAIDAREPMYQFAIQPTAEDSGATALCFDTQGRLYAATRMGVEIFDRNGRVTGILRAPAAEALTGLTFGGDDMRILFIQTANGKVFSRRVKATGVPADAEPIHLTKGSAG